MTSSRIAALPFELSNDHQVIAGGSVTTTQERRNGVLRLEGNTITVQWRVEREISLVGPEIRTNTERDGMRSVSAPLQLLGGARVRTRGRWWWRKWEVVITARDLSAFDALAGADGFDFEHPAELILPVRKVDIDLAHEFASEVELAIAEIALAVAEAAAAPAPLSTASGPAMLPPDSLPTEG